MKLKIKKEPTNDKLDRLRALANECNKALGVTGKVYVGDEHPVYERIKTGVTALDYVTGGGIPRAAMTLFSGGDSSGKTMLSLMTARAVQKAGGTVVWIAGEGFDRVWATALGVKLSQLIIIVAEMGDSALETAMTMLEGGDVDLLVIDSVQSLGTTRESEGGVDSEAYAGGGAPQLWGRVMRRAFAALNSGKTNAAIIAISQVRSKIGGFSRGPMDPESTGIWSIKHWKSIEVYCKKGEPLMDGKEEKHRILSREFKLKCKKNKTAASERVAAFRFYFEPVGELPFGLDNAETVVRLAKAYQILEVKGSWISGVGLRAQGEDAFLAQIRQQPKVLKDLGDAVLEAAKG